MPEVGNRMHPGPDQHRRLRVLFVYDCVYPESIGGMEHRNHELAAALAARGHSVTVAGFTREPRKPAPRYEIVSVGEPGRLYTKSGRRSLLEAIRFGFHLIRKPDLAEFDLVEAAHTPYLHLAPLAIRCAFARKPMIVTWTEYWGKYWNDYIGTLAWPAFAGAEWLAAQLGQTAFAISQFTADRLAQHRRGKNVQVLPCGIPVSRIRSIAKTSSNGPPLVYAGRLQKEKRVDILIEAIAELAPRVPGPLLSIIGDGPERSALADLCSELGVADRVVLVGRLPTNDDVWRVMSGARIAVQPSSREGFGLFPLEAMALGLPVVYCHSDESAVPEVVRHNEDGLCTEATSSSLASALDLLLADDDEYSRLSSNARRRAEEFDWDRIAAMFEESAQSILGS